MAAELSDQEKALLKWGVEFIFDAGIHSAPAAVNAVNLGNLVGRLIDPKQPPPAAKEPEKQ